MLKKLAPYTRGYRLYVMLGVLFSAGEAVLELELPQAMSEIVDVGIAGGDRSYILLTGLKMFLMAMAALGCGVGAAVLAAKAAMGFGANLRQAEYEQVQRFSFANIEHFSTASLITRLTNDVSSVQMTLFMGMRMCVRAPVMLVTAILIKATSPGPVIFCQERVGLHNKPFKMYKFRSMAVQSAAKEKSQWTTPGDPRVTPIGRFIRKTSIDELPQLFNVLKGDMSLVGPRPERPFFVEKFKEEIPRYMIKHQVRPGMTGWAQVNGYRGDTSITKRIEHDLYYIENWTLGFDFKIMFLTVFKGFINKNAY